MPYTGPYHINQIYASTTQKWSGHGDTEQNFKTNCADKTTYERLKNLGWIGTDIIYKFNSEGFRDDEFDQQPAGLALGCSLTQGIGIHADDTWPKQLEKMLGQKIWNLGSGGAALDTCYRFLEYWIEHLNIQFVACAVPSISRYEIFAATSSNWLSILPQCDVPHWLKKYQQQYLLHDQNSELNRRKNLSAMQNICNKHNVPFYYNLFDNFWDIGNARDLMHCGSSANYNLAKEFVNTINTQGKI